MIFFGYTFGKGIDTLLPRIKTESASGVDAPAPGIVAVGWHEFAEIGLLLGDRNDQVWVDPKVVCGLDDIVPMARHRRFVVFEVLFDQHGPGILARDCGFDLEGAGWECGKEKVATTCKLLHLLPQETCQTSRASKLGVEHDSISKKDNSHAKKCDNTRELFHATSIPYFDKHCYVGQSNMWEWVYSFLGFNLCPRLTIWYQLLFRD